jgi:hypothetical protein
MQLFTCSFIALVIYMGFVSVPHLKKFWSTDSLYHGLWARRFMTRNRFEVCMLDHPNWILD